MKKLNSSFIYSFLLIPFSSLVLIANCLLLTGDCSAQSPAIEWQNTIGGSGYDFAKSIFPVVSGGYIIGGNSFSMISGDKTTANFGERDFWLVKINDDGTVSWDMTYGGSLTDDIAVARPTADGGYIIGGGSYSGISGNKSESSIGSLDYWIIKTDASGTVQWQNTIGGTGTDAVGDIYPTSDGGYIVGGYSGSPISGDKTEPMTGGLFDTYDCWILKLDALGAIEWQNTIGSVNIDYCHIVRQTADGGYIVGASSSGGASGDKTEAGVGGSLDFWIFKLNATGSIIWQNSIGSSATEYFESLEITNDGGFIIGGYTLGGISGDKSESSFGLNDYWIVKLDNTGNIIWDKTIGGSDDDYLYSVIQTPDNGYLVGGFSASDISGYKSENQIGTGVFAYKDYWIVKLNSTGLFEWDNTIGGFKDDFLRALCVAPDGSYVIAGDSGSGATGDKTESQVGDATGVLDYWIIKLVTEVCAIPAELYADNITPTKATTHWNLIAAADLYQIWYRAVGAATWMKKSSTTNFKTLKSLSPETTYEYKVRTKCSDGVFSDFSPLQNFTTLPLREGEMTVQLEIELYPNPATDNIIIDIGSLTWNPEFDSGLHSLLTITNLMAEVVFETTTTTSITELNISHLPKGVYILNISNEIINKSIQFIRQ